jgi:hypothetical protein
MKKISAHKTSKPATLSAEQRARILERIREQTALEYFTCAYRKRQVRARIVIGLRPIPRRLFSDGASIRSEP